jgi:hypothetical protein
MIKTVDIVIYIVSFMHKSGDYLCLEKGEVYTITVYTRWI